MNNLSRIAIMSCAAFVLFASCKKTNKTTSCSSTLHGYTAPVDTMYSGASYTCNHGIINTTTGGMATFGSFTGSLIFTNQAAFNTSDNCYYVFGTSNLYKIDASGTTTAFAPADTSSYSSITYNSSTNKLYCIKTGRLAELTTTSTTFSATSLVMPAHPFDRELFSAPNIAVDNTSGDMYFVTGIYPSFYVEKYHPGASSSTVVASGTGGINLLELRFNKNDNMLYGLQLNADTVTYSFIKVNPAAGTISTVVNLGAIVNADVYSATLDPCANRYIISTTTNNIHSFILYQVDMSGAIVQHDTTTTFYQGLDVVY